MTGYVFFKFFYVQKRFVHVKNETNSKISTICTLGRERMMGQHLGKQPRGRKLEQHRRVKHKMELGRQRMELEMGKMVCKLVCKMVCRLVMSKLVQICRQMAMSKLVHIHPWEQQRWNHIHHRSILQYVWNHRVQPDCRIPVIE